MKRRIRIIALALGLSLLLCACGRMETAGEQLAESTNKLELTDVPANWELYTGSIHDITKACFELYELIYPDAYILWSGMGGGKEGFVVECAGADIAAFGASGILPDNVILETYHGEDVLDPRLPHEIPRRPESEVEFGDGMSMKMEREVYPPYPEHVRYIMESKRGAQLDYDVYLYKYVDEKWERCSEPSYAHIGWGVGFEAGVPKTCTLPKLSKWLGEGLYRIELAGCDIEEGEEYYVEFAVSADAEPLEPLTQETEETREAYTLNFFWQCELPENCTALSMTGEAEWPAEACSYAVGYGWAANGGKVAEKLLGGEYAYDAETDTYTAGTKTISFTDGGLCLTDSEPEVRAMRLAHLFAEFDEYRWNDDYSLLDWAVGLVNDGIDYASAGVSISNGELNFALKDALELKKAELSEEEFQAEYGELTEVFFKYGRTFHYYVSSPVMDDPAATRCTRVDGGGICGPEIMCMIIDGKMRELQLRNVPGSLTANDDMAAVVSPYDAAAAVLPELWKIETEFAVTKAEFSYAYHGGDLSTLRPTWVFTVEYGGSEQYFAVDALTGELAAGA